MAVDVRLRCRLMFGCRCCGIRLAEQARSFRSSRRYDKTDCVVGRGTYTVRVDRPPRASKPIFGRAGGRDR
jgi:hypothetical protein